MILVLEKLNFLNSIDLTKTILGEAFLRNGQNIDRVIGIKGLRLIVGPF